jgi:hypothetical protein
MHFLVFCEDVYQNARSIHQHILVQLIAVQAIKELPTFYGMWVFTKYRNWIYPCQFDPVSDL